MAVQLGTRPAVGEAQSSGLKERVLSVFETLAQSVAVVAPSATPAMTISITVGMCGNGAWLAYLLASVAVMLSALNVKVFAQRSATTGSLYSYVKMGCGERSGLLTGFALLAAYGFCISAAPIQFAMVANALLSGFGIAVGIAPTAIACVVIAAVVACNNIQLSAKTMLWAEISAMAIILVLCALAMHASPTVVDTNQLELRGMTGEGFRMALVMALFAICGFESAATLGVESNNPLKSVPRALLTCPVISGVFFVVVAYSMVHTFPGGVQALAKCEAPLLPLSNSIGTPLLGQLAEFGALLSFFACTLASINAAARTLFTMAREGHLPSIFERVHVTKQTPHIAVSLIAVAGILPGFALLWAKLTPSDVVGLTGTLSTYGFVFAYAAVSIAAPLYLRRLKLLRGSDIAIAVASATIMLGSFIFSLCPIPPAPYCYLPYVFLAYMAAGFLMFRNRRHS